MLSHHESAVSPGRQSAVDGRRSPSRRLQKPAVVLVAAFGIVVAFALGAMVRGLAPQGAASARVSIAGEFSGTVSLANHDGSKICVLLAGGGAQRCSVVYDLVGSRSLKVGDRVSVTEAWIRHDSVSEEVYLVTNP